MRAWGGPDILVSIVCGLTQLMDLILTPSLGIGIIVPILKTG